MTQPSIVYRNLLRGLVRMFDPGLLLPGERISNLTMDDLEALATLIDEWLRCPGAWKKLRPPGYEPSRA